MTSKKYFTNEEAKQIGEELGIEWSRFDVEQYRMGLDVEMEHGTVDAHTNVTNDDPIMTGKIALAHLNEFPDYYTRLKKLEKKAEKERKQKELSADHTPQPRPQPNSLFDTEPQRDTENPGRCPIAHYAGYTPSSASMRRLRSSPASAENPPKLPSAQMMR